MLGALLLYLLHGISSLIMVVMTSRHWTEKPSRRHCINFMEICRTHVDIQHDLPNIKLIVIQAEKSSPFDAMPT